MFDCCGVLPVPCPAVVSSGATEGWQRDSRGCYVVNSSQQLLSSPLPAASTGATAAAAAVPHVYAIGDCCVGPVAAGKLAYTAELQAVVAAANVSRQVQRGVDAAPLLSFPLSLSSVLPAPSLVCCSLGAADGVLVFNDIVVSGWLAALAKYVIERSKLGQYRGEWVSVGLWAVGEPMTFMLNRVYRAVAQTWRSLPVTVPVPVLQRRHSPHTTQ